MSRLLVIEPNPMLRYALAAALTPDHMLRFVESLPESAAIENIDAVIVDAAMLRQSAPSWLDVNAVDGWQLPTVWLDDGESAAPAGRRDWVTLTLPVVREQLLKALFECLNPPSGAPTVKKFEAAPASKPRPKKATATDAPAVDDANVIELIELVEVVDDEPDNG